MGARLLISILMLIALSRVQSGFFPFFSNKETKDSKVEEDKQLDQQDPQLRGISPLYISKMTSDIITCDNGQLFLNRSCVNDDFCDCDDGTDEPGFSACSSSTFHCLNRGYKIVSIPASRVDDGICDCCDGSDEGTRVNCPNICDTVAQSEKAHLEKIKTAYEIGSKIREEYIEEVQERSKVASMQFEEYKKEVEQKKNEIEIIRERRIREEETEDQEAKLKREQIMEKVSERLGTEILRIDYITQLVSTLFDLLLLTEDDVRDATHTLLMPSNEHDDNNDEVPPEDIDTYHNEDVEHEDTVGKDIVPQDEEAEKKRKEEEAISSCLITNYTTDPRIHLLCVHNPTETFLRDLLLHVVQEKNAFNEFQLIYGYFIINGRMDGAREYAQSMLGTGGDEQQQQQQHEGQLNTCPTEFSNKEGLCTFGNDLITLLNEAEKEYVRKEAQEARTSLSNLEASLKAAEAKVIDAERSTRDLQQYPDNLAFVALRGQCFKTVDGKFTYDLCLMQSVTQSAVGENTVELGRFAGFENHDDGKVVMKFDGGDHCYAHGPRTATVDVSCGQDNILSDASEPSTCAYQLKFESPAACSSNFAISNGLSP